MNENPKCEKKGLGFVASGRMVLLGANIEFYRKKQGMSRATLAELTGKDESTIYRWENGKCARLLRDGIDDIAIFLGVDVGQLLAGTGLSPSNELVSPDTESGIDPYQNFLAFVRNAIRVRAAEKRVRNINEFLPEVLTLISSPQGRVQLYSENPRQYEALIGISPIPAYTESENEKKANEDAIADNGRLISHFAGQALILYKEHGQISEDFTLTG